MVGDSGISDLSSGGIIDRGLVLLNVRLDGKELGDKTLAWNLVAIEGRQMARDICTGWQIMVESCYIRLDWDP